MTHAGRLIAFLGAQGPMLQCCDGKDQMFLEKGLRAGVERSFSFK